MSLLPANVGDSYSATPGDIHAYDVRTGKLAWVFHSVPHPGEFGYDTWPPDAWKTYGGVHNWNEMTVDEKRGIAYIPFGTARYDFYGADRQGQDLFGNSLVALDAQNGEAAVALPDGPSRSVGLRSADRAQAANGEA